MAITVFIVDDSEIVLSVCKGILEAAGYRVLTQSRANGSISQLIWERPQLLLLDVNMPQVTGDSLARMCAKTAETTGSLVVLHSSMPEADLEKVVRASGAHGYIRKTESSGAFLRAVQKFIGPAAGSSAGSSAIASAGATHGAHPVTPAASARKESHGATRQAIDRLLDGEPDGEVTESGVLLVDRDMATLSALREVVRGLGHRSDFALSSRQASDKLRSESPPSIVVASAELPDEGLATLYSSAVSLDANWGQRFVLITSGDPQKCKPAGFSGAVLRKPIAAEALREAIRRALPAS